MIEIFFMMHIKVIWDIFKVYFKCNFKETLETKTLGKLTSTNSFIVI